jgi:predicted phage terminase large subunit-like protein
MALRINNQPHQQTGRWHRLALLMPCSVVSQPCLDSIPYHRHKPHAILVEDASSGIQLVQELKEQRIYVVKPVRPEGDKKSRLFAQSAYFESGVVRMPVHAPWLDDYLHELTSFPSTKFDDQVDATSQALAYLKNWLDEPAVLTYYRDQAEEIQRRQGV